MDIKPELDEQCLKTDECLAKILEYEKCMERIKDIEPIREPHCWGQYFEIVHCVDVCTHPKLWPTLK